LPVIVVFCPKLREDGVKSVIFACVEPPPQSYQLRSRSVSPADSSTFETVDPSAGALLISMQNRSSPLDDVALHVVVVVANEDGRLDAKLMSTFTGTPPAASGKLIASKVSEPTPNGRLQVLDCAASPSHFKSCPMAPFMTRSKFAADTASSSFPVPVIVVFWPNVKDEGVNPVIVACVLPAPQSDQLRDKSLAVAAPAIVENTAAAFIAKVVSKHVQKV